MWFLVVGVLLLVLKLAEIGPPAAWHWGWILLPFGLAAVWWAISDALALPQKRAIRKMEERKVARRERDMKALGLDVHMDKRIRVLRDSGTRGKRSAAEGQPPAEAPRKDPRP